MTGSPRWAGSAAAALKSAVELAEKWLRKASRSPAFKPRNASATRERGISTGPNPRGGKGSTAMVAPRSAEPTSTVVPSTS
jgi:hypothetical protein